MEGFDPSQPPAHDRRRATHDDDRPRGDVRGGGATSPPGWRIGSWVRHPGHADSGGDAAERPGDRGSSRADTPSFDHTPSHTSAVTARRPGRRVVRAVEEPHAAVEGVVGRATGGGGRCYRP